MFAGPARPNQRSPPELSNQLTVSALILGTCAGVICALDRQEQMDAAHATDWESRVILLAWTAGFSGISFAACVMIGIVMIQVSCPGDPSPPPRSPAQLMLSHATPFVSPPAPSPSSPSPFLTSRPTMPPRAAERT